MKFKDENLEKRAAEIIMEEMPTAKKEKLVANFSSLVYNPGLGNSSPLTKTSEYLRAASGWVYACVVAICDEVANIDLHLMRKNKQGKLEEVYSHPALDVLYKANNFTTKFDLFWLTQQYLELAGEAPWFVQRNKSGTPSDILLLRPDLLDVIPGSKDNYLDGYKYLLSKGNDITLLPEEVVYLRYPDPTRPFRGKGTLQAVAKTVDIDNFSEDFNRNFFYNSATPGAVLQTDQKLTAEVRDYLSKSIKKLHQGAENAHKAMILESGLEWKPMMLSQRDMDFMEQQRFSRDKILGIFRVPRTVLGITDDVNRANAEATDYVFSKRTIKPKMQRIVDQLNEFFIPLFPDGDSLMLTFTDPVPENLELKLQYYQAGIQNGFMSINEVREEIGKDGIGKEGDNYYMPFSLSPIGSNQNQNNLNADKNVEKFFSARGRKDKDVKNKKEKLEKEIANRIAEIVPSLLGKKFKQVKKKDIEPVKEEISVKQKFWEMKIAKTNTLEKEYVKKTKDFFGDQKSEVLDSMPKKAGKKDFDKWLLDPKEQGKKAYKVYAPVMSATILAGAKDAFELLNLEDEELDLSNPTVQKFLRDRSYDLAFGMTEETNRLLGESLSVGVKDGESIAQLRKRVEEVFDGMEQYRSERIARSEVIKASNWGTEEAYKESGVVQGKEWLTAFDERTCEECMAMDGKTVKLGKEFFDDDYSDGETPPLHPNCRCTIIPVIK